MNISRGRYVIGAFGIVIALGLLGAFQLDREAFLAGPTNQLYRVLQLFFAEGDWTTSYRNLPWALEFARFAAPVVTVGSLVLLFAEGIWVAIVNSRVRFFDDHIIVVGLSDEAMHLVRHCRAQNLNVVVVDNSLTNAYFDECRRLYVPVLQNDAKRPEAMRRARFGRAKSLVSFVNDDDDNVELSLLIQEHLAASGVNRDPPLKVILQVSDMQLANRLESYPKFFDYPQQLEVRFFNIEEQSARALFRDYSPEVYADALAETGVHIAIAGFNDLGRHILSTALKGAHYANEKLLTITVLDPDASASRLQFQQQCPEISLAANVRFMTSELTPEAIRQNVHKLSLGDVTMFIACVGADSANLSLALAMRQMALLALLPNAPVFVALKNSKGLARLIESGQGNPEIPDGLYPFGMISDLMRVDRVLDERLDNIAIALHEQYLESLGKQEVAQPSHRPWGSLPEMFRNVTRAQGDHVETKLRAAGYCFSDEPTNQNFSDRDVLRLARAEKTRWIGERTSLGWRHASYRSDLAMVHPEIKPWQYLTPEEQMYDIDSVRALPKLLRERLSVGIQPEVIIGITGHRAGRLANHLPYVEEQVRRELTSIAEKYPNVSFAVLSALADGSDRLVARLAVEMLDARLYAALPLPYEIYRRSFGHTRHLNNTASNEEFQTFVGMSSRYFEMPLKFGGAQLLERDDADGAAARAQQYALAGAYIVSRAAELIAIWDGRSARGEGGTGDVVRWRQAGEVPEQYRFPGAFFPTVEMTQPRVIQLPDEATTAEASAG